MKKAHRFTALVLLSAFLLGFVPAPTLATNGDYDPQHTMLALNMAIVSVHRIVTTQDRVVLDQEYQNIINNLSLGNIESDYDLTGLYQELMSLISQKRLREEETRMLQARYNRKEQSQIMNALSGVRAYGGDLFSWLGSLAVSCISSFFQYEDAKAELREGLDGELWQLKKEDIADCNELQERLLQSSWNLLRQYRLPDAYRLTQGSMGNFYKALQEASPAKRLRMLRVLEDEFRVYPPYWFLRARAAQDAKDEKETRKCFDKFDEVWRPVLRRDPYKLEAAKFRIRELAASGKPVEEIRPGALELLEVVRENTPKEDWANNLFAGVAYFVLGEKEAGVECVELNVDFGYETAMSEMLLKQMKQGNLSSAAMQDAVRSMKLDGLLEEMEVGDKETAAALTDWFEGRGTEALERLAGTSENPAVFHALRLVEQGKTGWDYAKVTGYVEKFVALADKAGEAYAEIVPLVEKYATENDSAEAKLLLADMTQFGLGVAKDPTKAGEFFSALAQGGNPYAQFVDVQIRLGGQQYGGAYDKEKIALLNATYSGKYLGSVFTAEQSAAIRAGTFDGMALGDYWTINGINWRIADFDYLLRSGSVGVKKHHVMIVPDKNLYDARMNSSNTSEGGYAVSEMRASGLTRAKEMISSAFGAEHALADYGVELMTKEMVFDSGDRAFSLFRVHSESSATGEWYWLQDVVSAAYFARVNSRGNAYSFNASNAGGVRPAFALY